MDENEKIARFSMKVDIKSDGRIHYTGVRAEDKHYKTIFKNVWQDRGEWEVLELADNDMIIGMHGYLHMDWQIIHLGLLIAQTTGQV